MLQTVLAAIVAAALFAAFSFDLFGAAVLSFVVATGAATGKLAFDSLVQRAAPDVNYGRSFARFEARFQFAWVVGAFIPAVIPLNLAVGGTGVALVALVALVSFALGRPVTSAMSLAFVRNGTRRMRRRDARTRAVSSASTAGDARQELASGSEGDGGELSLEDLRPSQPAAPAGTEHYTVDWGVIEPIVSSVEGVEFEQPGSLPARNDERPDSIR